MALTLRIIATWGGDMTSARREAEKAFKKTEVKMGSDISLEDVQKRLFFLKNLENLDILQILKKI